MRGDFITPWLGTGYKGWKVDTGWDGYGPIFNPENQIRDYSDIEAIFSSRPNLFKTREEHDEKNHFHSYIVESG